jgi:cellulase/cellobiase CelA1
MPRSLFANTLNAVAEGAGGGGTNVQDWVSTGVPEHPGGDEESRARAWVASGWHAPQESYVYVQATGESAQSTLTVPLRGTVTTFVAAEYPLLVAVTEYVPVVADSR